MSKIINKSITKLLIFGLALGGGLGIFAIVDSARAVNYSGFQAGNIISDAVMSNHNSMSEAEIYSFMRSKNSCNNTEAYKATWYPGYNYHVENGHFVCLADESFNGETAVHIIWQAAQDYRINPQVLLVMLQKEQGLITDTWPNDRQYRTAMGYGCPDTAACDAYYYGFKNQVRNAAALLRAVLDGGWSNYPVGWQWVRYSPNVDCGGSTIYIANRATSALYRYTPYQPNAEALAAGWGTAYCGAYGNRNFYGYFTDWFGSTQVSGASADYGNYSYNPEPVKPVVVPATRGEKLSSIADGAVYAVASAINENYVLDLTDNAAADGTNIQLYQSNQTGAQRFKFIYHGASGFYEIVNAANGKALDVSGAGTDAGTNVQIWSNNLTCAQLWKITETADGYYDIQSSCSQLRLDASGGVADNNVNVWLWTANETAAQKWRIVATDAIFESNKEYSIAASANENYAMNPRGGAYDGANAEIYSWYGGAGQRFKFEFDKTTGLYTIINVWTGMPLDVAGAGVNAGTNVQIWSRNNSCAQKWQITPTGDGYYDVRSSCSNLRLDLMNGCVASNANTQLWTANGSAAQKWAIQPFEKYFNSVQTYMIKSAVNQGYALDVDGGRAVNGTNVQTWSVYGGINQAFRFEYDYTTGLSTIINTATGMPLDVSGAGTWNGANVQIWSANYSCAQQWRIGKNADGSYDIRSSCGNGRLDLMWAAAHCGSNIQIWERNNSAAQRWWIEKR